MPNAAISKLPVSREGVGCQLPFEELYDGIPQKNERARDNLPLVTVFYF